MEHIAAGIGAMLLGSCTSMPGDDFLLIGHNDWKKLDVTSNPPGAGVELYLDGKGVEYCGTTPLTKSFLYNTPRDDERRAAVGVRMDGYFPQVRDFLVGSIPGKMNFHFDLLKIPSYSFRIVSEPTDARVEGEMEVVAGKTDWVLLGRTPLDLEHRDDDGDGIFNVRVRKPGYWEEEASLLLGQDMYRIELEEKE